MRFSIFFFSGTGNTWWVTREFCKIVKQNADIAEYFSIEHPNSHDETILKEIWMNSDAIGFAYPIYCSAIPSIMKDFMEYLCTLVEKKKISKSDPYPADSQDKLGFVLTTMALFSGDGALVGRKYFKRMRLKFNGAINLQMASNMGIPYFRYNPVSLQKLAKRKTRNRKKLTKLYQRLSAGRKYKEGRNPFLILLGWLQRIFLGVEERIMQNNLKVNSEECIDCDQCIELCPKENIHRENDQIQFHDKCTSCMRCYNLCPVDAIQVFKDYADPQKYRRYKGPEPSFQSKKLFHFGNP